MNPLVVDVSHWQPVDLPWAEFKAAGVRAVIVQLTHGTRYEAHAYEHLDRAAEAGLLLGVYHFMMPDSDPIAQAATFYSHLPNGIGVHLDRVALDVEAEGLTSQKVREWLSAWSRYWPGYTFHPLIYTAKYWWESHIPHAEVDWRYYELWAAGGMVYDQHVTYPPPGLVCPLPWPWTGVSLHQFTGQGRLPGYASDLDLSYNPYVKDEREFTNWWQGRAPWDDGYTPPEPEEEGTMPITQAEIDALKAKKLQAETALAGLGGLIDSLVADRPAPLWHVGDVALAAVDPLLCYSAPGGPQTRSLHATWPIDIVAVSADGLWLEVAAGLWCKAADLKHKGS